MALKALLVVTILTHLGYGLNIEGFNICKSHYALCSKALCNPIAGNSTHAECYCEGPFDDLNIGHSSCAERDQSLLSTFSLHNIFQTSYDPVTYRVNCMGQYASAWANCPDALCSTATGAVVCTCPVEAVSNNTNVSPTCPGDGNALKNFCNTLRSAASPDLAGTTQELLSSFYSNPPSIQACNIG